MPPVAWTELQRAGEVHIATVNIEAGHRTHGARECVDSLFYLIDLDASVMPNPLEATILGHSWEVVEASHARWALVTAITAVDLCAAALGRLFCNITGDAHDLSVRSALYPKNKRERERLKHLPEGVAGWLRRVYDDPNFGLLKDMRDRFTHQVHPRTQNYTGFPGSPGTADVPSLKPAARMMLDVPMGDGAVAMYAIPDLIGSVADFAHVYVGALLDALGDEAQAQRAEGSGSEGAGEAGQTD